MLARFLVCGICLLLYFAIDTARSTGSFYFDVSRAFVKIHRCEYFIDSARSTEGRFSHTPMTFVLSIYYISYVCSANCTVNKSRTSCAPFADILTRCMKFYRRIRDVGDVGFFRNVQRTKKCVRCDTTNTTGVANFFSANFCKVYETFVSDIIVFTIYLYCLNFKTHTNSSFDS